MEFILRFIVVFLALIISGCETAKLWSGNADEEYVKVTPQSADEDVESALKRSGRAYYCQDLYASTHPNNKVCYAKLTTEDKIKKIEIKLQKTPESLVVDTGHTIKVVGSVALNILMHSNFHKG